MRNLAPSILVLENKQGHIVRVFNVEEKKFALIQRLDTKRVEVVDDVKRLEQEEIPFKLISQLTLEQLKKGGFEQEGMGSLRLVEEVDHLAPQVELEGEDDEEFKKVLKYTAIGQIALILFIFAVGYILSEYVFKKEEPVLVTVVKQEEIKPEPPQPKPRKVVQMSEKKIKKVNITKKTVEVAKTKITTPKKVTQKSAPLLSKVKTQHSEGPKVPNKPRDLGQMGALGLLGGSNKAAGNRQGLDIGAVNKGGLAGFGAGKGRSGTDRAVFAAGLVATSAGGGIGSGSGAGGGGGYNSRGMGSGHSGYGKHSLAGSSSGFVAPLSAEAEIEGGLERSQIEAVIRRNQGQILYCYERTLQTKPSVKGRVHMAWVINGSGRVSLAKVEDSSLDDSQVESCIAGKIRGWKFPAPKGNVDVKVSYPFNLSRTL